MKEYKVRTSRKPTYEPIIFKKGDHFIIKEDLDSDWVLCESKYGECILPSCYIKRKADLGTLLIDFNTEELWIEPDDILIKKHELHGWVYGYKTDDPKHYGWAPISHLEKHNDQSI